MAQIGDIETSQAVDMPVPGLWFRSLHQNAPASLVLYVYGGTFAMNHGPSHEKIATQIAMAIKGDVLLPCYSLAPERAFPLAIEDIVATYMHLLSEGWQAEQIVVLGDTAGASIALGALLSLRDQGAPMPGGVVALFPWVDLTMSGGSYVDQIRDDGRVSDVELLATFLTDYLQGADPRSPLASPALADLRGLPPFHIHANVNDVLADDARLLTEQAKRAQVPAQLHLWDDVPATLQRDEPFSTQMQMLFASIGKFVRSHSDLYTPSNRFLPGQMSKKDRLQEEYLAIMEDNIQPHMQQRIEEMFAWSKDHGPDWVWSFIERRIEHGALVTQEQIEREWLARLFADSIHPTLLLTASRYVVHANRAAHSYLERGPYLRRKAGRLVGTSPQVDAILTEVLQLPFLPEAERETMGPASLARIDFDDHATLLLRSHRLEAHDVGAVSPPVAVLRLLLDETPGIQIEAGSLAIWYGLSPREAALAVRFASGTSLADYADEEGVSMATVRTQFAHLKGKLGAADQAGVVRKVLNAAALNY